jgi:hypothetical protein
VPGAQPLARCKTVCASRASPRAMRAGSPGCSSGGARPAAKAAWVTPSVVSRKGEVPVWREACALQRAGVRPTRVALSTKRRRYLS